MGMSAAEHLVRLRLDGQTVQIIGGLLILVGRHGEGKTRGLTEIADGKYEAEGFDGLPFYLGLDKGPETAALIKGAGIYDDQGLAERLSRQLSPEVLQSVRQRITLADLGTGGIDEKLSYRRLALLALLELSQERRLIVIDEPELLAHPTIRKEMAVLIRGLQQRGHLVIIATNLDNIVTDLVTDVQQVVRVGIEDGRLRLSQIDMALLEKEVWEFYHRDPRLLGRFSCPDQTDRGLRSITDRNYRSYLGSAVRDKLFNIMFAKAAIIGEGASEGILFQYLDTVQHPSWAREREVTFISCLGKSTLPLYFLFLNSLGLKVVAMHDRDKPENPVHSAYGEAFSRYEKAHPGQFAELILDPDLEAELHIEPPYKLEAIEKPVNVYVNTFVTSAAGNAVAKLADRFLAALEKMEEAL